MLGRVVRYLVKEAGIRQLVDIGAGLPTRDNVHQIAHRTGPAVRVVYVDNDPVILAHAETRVTYGVTLAAAP
ncbi:MAG TPA: SAM-dependent methyltransferase [Trebonia sp.]